MEISMYVLCGTWHSRDTNGVEVLGISEDIGPLLRRLDRIADTKAGDYVELSGYLEEERGEMYYEVVDAGWRYARFHISEHHLTILGRTAVETG